VRAGVAAGLAVLCQKPFAPDLAQATALAADVAGKRVMVHENWRFRRYYRDMAAWMGDVGEVQQASMVLLTSGLLADATGARPALVRQPFMQGLTRMLVAEVLIHHLDTLRFLLGPMEVVAARLGQSCADMAGEDNALITLRTSGGAGVVLLGNLAAAGAPPSQADQLLLLGRDGALRLDGAHLRLQGRRSEDRVYDLPACYQGSYDATIAHFVTALEQGTPFETPPDENLHTLRLVEDCYRLSGWRLSGWPAA
jgi:predicted dehydrogenase